MSALYQCIEKCGDFLLAARGLSLDTFDLQTGSLLSTWNVSSAQESNPSGLISEDNQGGLKDPGLEPLEDNINENTPPAKRRKLSIADKDDTTPQTKQTKAAKKENRRSDAVTSGLEAAAVILLAGTADGKHVIAVTGEDKSIRVFEQDPGGSLKQLSQRTMPKRPCAIALTADDTTIISADKFGDVYSLPLFVQESSALALPDSASATPEPLKPFAPAANTFTVHSQRNRMALENQKRLTNRPAAKSEPTFEHKLILGHVSMLTDLALVTLQGRNYILTADRDEHIRVSRGIPMAHIIEGFCLGHTEFVSRLCIPKNRPDVLVSGGGDDELLVWNWVKGNVVSRANLKLHVLTVLHTLGETRMIESDESLKIVVSGIKHLSLAAGNVEGGKELIIVTCEGIPAVFSFFLTALNELQYIHTLRVEGNVLGVSTASNPKGLVLSIDNVHKPGSTTDPREVEPENVASLQAFGFINGAELFPTAITFKAVQGKDDSAASVSNLLYSLKNLRKRDNDTLEEDE